MGLVTLETFIDFPEQLEELNAKIKCNKVDNLLVATTWMKSNRNTFYFEYRTNFTDEVMNNGLKTLKQKRTAQKEETEQEKAVQFEHVLHLFNLGEEDMVYLKACNITIKNQSILIIAILVNGSNCKELGTSRQKKHEVRARRSSTECFFLVMSA